MNHTASSECISTEKVRAKYCKIVNVKNRREIIGSLAFRDYFNDSLGKMFIPEQIL